MVCNAIAAVATAYKSLRANRPWPKDEPPPVLRFQRTSVHYDARTFTLQDDSKSISLYTLSGRVSIPLIWGAYQWQTFEAGEPREAVLVEKDGHWYFHLTMQMHEGEEDTSQDGLSVSALEAAPESYESLKARGMGVDHGENNLVATSAGLLFGGGALRHQRDCYLALRGRLQKRGTQSARQQLGAASGRESRHVRHVNHQASKRVVEDAKRLGVSVVIQEDLTDIRKNIKAGRRVRTRLHRWAFRELQTMIEYKAIAAGLEVAYVNPAYTSQTCSKCISLGKRTRHRFRCKCGHCKHADVNGAEVQVVVWARSMCGILEDQAPDFDIEFLEAIPRL